MTHEDAVAMGTKGLAMLDALRAPGTPNHAIEDQLDARDGAIGEALTRAEMEAAYLVDNSPFHDLRTSALAIRTQLAAMRKLLKGAG